MNLLLAIEKTFQIIGTFDTCAGTATDHIFLHFCLFLLLNSK